MTMMFSKATHAKAASHSLSCSHKFMHSTWEPLLQIRDHGRNLDLARSVSAESAADMPARSAVRIGIPFARVLHP